ncbi:PPA1309 family protein [Kibdelosporangium philippinense]|uniref:PPA1309 family protein n=1 Tax=Kibdelosporangium philippinense TaxID=211113 RepID=UPI00355758AE
MTAVSSTSDALPALAAEVEQFVASAGWDQPAQLFALVPTAELLRMQPELAGQLDAGSELTPIAQDSLPDGDLGAALAGIMWPDAVRGCALVQEIVVLPPDAEAEMNASGEDEARLRQLAAEHPQRQEARLVAAVLRDGGEACVMRLRDHEDLLKGPDLAPNLTAALHATFA